jgi:hypothetical protein
LGQGEWSQAQSDDHGNLGSANSWLLHTGLWTNQQDQYVSEVRIAGSSAFIKESTQTPVRSGGRPRRFAVLVGTRHRSFGSSKRLRVTAGFGPEQSVNCFASGVTPLLRVGQRQPSVRTRVSSSTISFHISAISPSRNCRHRRLLWSSVAPWWQR